MLDPMRTARTNALLLAQLREMEQALALARKALDARQHQYEDAMRFIAQIVWVHGTEHPGDGGDTCRELRMPDAATMQWVWKDWQLTSLTDPLTKERVVQVRYIAPREDES